MIVDRSTGFGSPFPVTKGTSTSCGVTTPAWYVGTWNGPALWIADTREKAVRASVMAYRVWINAPAQAALRERAALELRGRDLACWCPIHENGRYVPCHADVLLSVANNIPLEDVISENLRRAKGETVR